MKVALRFVLVVVALVLLIQPGSISAQKGKPGQPPPPPDPAIAFSLRTDTASPPYNIGSLAVMNADGTNQQVVLQGSSTANHCCPKWVPIEWSLSHGGGRHLVFRSNIGGPGIYVIKLGETTPLKIVSTQRYPASWAAWSPVPLADGYYYILFADGPSGGETDLYAVREDGANLVNLTERYALEHPQEYLKVWSESAPSWNPWGSRFVACVDYPDVSGQSVFGDLFVFDVGFDGLGSLKITSHTNITLEGPLANFDPGPADWGTQHDWIVASFGTQEAGSADLWVIDLTGAAPPRNITNTPNLHEGEGNPSWSPDDGRVVFFRMARKDKGPGNVRHALFVVRTDGTGYQQLTTPATGQDHVAPDWRRNP